MAKKKKKKTRRSFTSEQVVMIREGAAEGMLDEQLARHFKCSAGAIAGIRRGVVHAKAGGPITRKKGGVKFTAGGMPTLPALRKAADVKAKRVNRQTDLMRAAKILEMVGTKWYEIKAAHAILGVHIAEVEEAING